MLLLPSCIAVHGCAATAIHSAFLLVGKPTRKGGVHMNVFLRGLATREGLSLGRYISDNDFTA